MLLSKPNYYNFVSARVLIIKIANAISTGKLPEHVNSTGYEDSETLTAEMKKYWREHVRTKIR